MSWVTVIWSMIASACLTLAVMHLLVWWRRPTGWVQALFFVSALGTAVLAILELWSMRATTPAEYGMVLRWAQVPYWAVSISLLAFVLFHLRAGRAWLGWTAAGLRTLTLVLNFVFTPNIQYREITALRHIRFLSELVSVPEGVTNVWVLIPQAGLLVFLIFAVDATITIFRRGDRWSAKILSSAIVVFVMATMAQTVLTFWGIVYFPITPSLYFLGIVTVIAYDMSLEVSQAADLSERFRQNAEWLDLAADSADMGLWHWDFKSDLLWITEKTRALYGLASDGQVALDTVLSRVHPDDLAWIVSASQECRASGADFRKDYRIVMPDGSCRWLKVFAKAHRGPSGVPERMTGVSLDITGRKQAELEIAQQRNELAHVARVSTMNQLASTLAHELNQPLGAILRNAEAGEIFLQGPSPDLDELRAILADIRTDDQRAGAVIDRMRTLMKQRKTESRRLDIKLVVDDVVSLIRPDAERRLVRLDVVTDPTLPDVRGDRVQLQQVLINLLLNAMDAVGDNPPARRRVTLRARTVSATVELGVSDTGQGITASQILRVFEPFFTSKPNGLGMGLAISNDIVKQHGGQLWAENQATGGATFTFSLPAMEVSEVS